MYYQKQITITSEFINNFRKEQPPDDSSFGVIKNTVAEIVQMMCDAIKRSDENQIEYYHDILKELEAKKNSNTKH